MNSYFLKKAKALTIPLNAVSYAKSVRKVRDEGWKIHREGRFTLKSVDFDDRKNLFRTVIIDESHKCKTSSTQQSKFVQGICIGKEYILELTGTPVVNNNVDLVQQLTITNRLGDFGAQALVKSFGVPDYPNPN